MNHKISPGPSFAKRGTHGKVGRTIIRFWNNDVVKNLTPSFVRGITLKFKNRVNTHPNTSC